MCFHVANSQFVSKLHHNLQVIFCVVHFHLKFCVIVQILLRFYVFEAKKYNVKSIKLTSDRKIISWRNGFLFVIELKLEAQFQCTCNTPWKKVSEVTRTWDSTKCIKQKLKRFELNGEIFSEKMLQVNFKLSTLNKKENCLTQ